MKPILVATDFSANARDAAYYAADMALSVNGYLVLLHVGQLPVAISEIPVVVDPRAMAHDLKRTMSDLERDLIRYSHGKVMVETEIRFGIFSQELGNMCSTIKPYAVVMGCQGTTAAERFFFGTHTVYAMKHLMYPLIAVPPGVKFSSIKRIGLACDLNEVVASTPVDELSTLVKDFKAELHVLNTGKKEEFDPEVVFQSGLLQEMLHDLNPVYHFITNDNIDAGILEFAEKDNIDLLIVIPRRSSLIDKLTHKSHTKQLVLHSHIPVMALHNEHTVQS